MGDVATNDGESGHQTTISDHRPDLTLLLEGVLTVFDLKVFAPIGSDAGEVGSCAAAPLCSATPRGAARPVGGARAARASAQRCSCPS